MIDILSVVYDFIRTYSFDASIKQYTEDQIIQGWQNVATLPNTNEFCVITCISSTRIGKPTNIDNVALEQYSLKLRSLIEHTVQVDFCSSEPNVSAAVTGRRAAVLNTFSNSSIGVNFFKEANPSLSLMFCDDIRNLSGLDETQTYQTRYSLDLHISEVVETQTEIDSFDSLKIRIKDVDVYHKVVTNKGR